MPQTITDIIFLKYSLSLPVRVSALMSVSFCLRAVRKCCSRLSCSHPCCCRAASASCWLSSTDRACTQRDAKRQASNHAELELGRHY